MNEILMLDSGDIGLVVQSRVHGTQVIRVSARDYPKISDKTWSVVRTCKSTLYAAINSKSDNGKRSLLYMHRVLMDFPAKGLHVDHVNENGLDNSKTNLRILTHGENIWRGRNGKRQRY